MSGQSGAAQDEAALMESFIAILGSARSLAIPNDTLFGAITHFVSTTPLSDLPAFILALVASPGIWGREEVSAGSRNAIRYAVGAKVDLVQASLSKAFFSSYRSGRQIRRWLDAVGTPVVSEGSGVGRSQTISALLEGMKDVPDIEWGGMKLRLEEELAVEAAAYDMSKEDGLDALYDAVTLTPDTVLSVLDVESILPDLVGRHLDLMTRRDRAEEATKCASSVARLLKMADRRNEQDRQQTWAIMRSLCEECGIMLEQGEIPDLQTAFASYLAVASSVVDIIIHSNPPAIPSSSRHSSHPSADIAYSILFALFDFAGHTRPPSQATDIHTRVWYGCLDVIEARGEVQGIDHLFSRLSARAEDPTPDQTAFILSLGEQTVGSVTVATMQRTLLPLCQRCVLDPSEKDSFEAAHALLLAKIRASGKVPASTERQSPFMEELLPWYSRLLVTQYKDGHLTPERLQSAYPTALSAALDCSSETHYTCLEMLLESLKRAEDPMIAQTLRKTRIAVTPHIPHDDIRGYLDDLAWCILDTKSHTSERKDLVEMAFKMVLEGLPDENRRIGMGWWLRWKPQFQGHISMNSPRAKL